MNILLLNGENVQAISIARALKDYGYNVFSFASSKISAGYASKYIDKKYVCPDIAKDEAGFMNFICSFLKSYNIDIIIPLGNDSAEFLSKNKSIFFEKYSVKCAIQDFNIFIEAHNKELLMKLCERNNIPHPRTRAINESNLESASAYVKFPALIKPNISAGARGITKVNSIVDLKAVFSDINHTYGDCTLQEYVNHSGVYYNVMVHRDYNGEINGYAIIKISRYFPLKGGTSCFCETIEHPKLLKMCEKTLNVLNWVGFADFDVLEEKETGKLKLIEINPRIPSCIHAAYISNINFPQLIIESLIKKESKPQKYVPGGFMRWFSLDVMWFIYSKERFKFRPSWFKFFGKNTFYQDGSWKDPLPMMFGAMEGVKKVISSKYRKSKSI